MINKLQNAKLILAAGSPYASGTITLVKPIGGSATVVRAGATATRVNSTGLIAAVSANVPRLDWLDSTCPVWLVEDIAENRFTYSNDFSNVIWSKAEITPIATSIISPDGTVNGWKLNDTAVNAQHAILRFVVDPENISFFVKDAEYTRCCIENYSDGGRVVFDIVNKTVVSTSANFTNGKVEEYANGFVRVSADTVATTGSKAIGLGLINLSNATTFAGTGTSGIYVYGAQEADGLSSYIPTVASAVTRNADDISVTVPSGVSEITTTFEDNTTDIETTIPGTFTLPFGRIKSVVMI